MTPTFTLRIKPPFPIQSTTVRRYSGAQASLQRSVPISRFDHPRTPIPQKAQNHGDDDYADVNDKPSMLIQPRLMGDRSVTLAKHLARRADRDAVPVVFFNKPVHGEA